MDKCNEAERWLPISGHQGFYEASDLGRIRSVDRTIVDALGRTRRLRGCVLSPKLSGSRDPRLAVSLYGRNNHYVHRLVLITFRGAPPKGTEGCHNNGDKFDNRLENLRWDTHSENMFDMGRHGTDFHRNITHCPRGHRLAKPNLCRYANRSGIRYCLACNRTYADQSYAQSQGRLFEDFQAAADEHYERIMRPKLRVCPHCGQPLPPSLIRSAVYCGKRCRDAAWILRKKETRVHEQRGCGREGSGMAHQQR